MRNKVSLERKTAFITGGGRGIGAAIARELAELGMTCVIAGRTDKLLRKTAEEIGKGCIPMVCDVTDWRSVEAAAEQVEAKFGKLDALINNAGIGSFSAKLHELPTDEWDKVMNTNLRGVYYCIKAFTPLLMKASDAHIVNISSLAGKNALPKGAVYAASKWGLNGLSYSVAEELRGSGIRVSVVCPGSVDTELSPHAGKDHSKMLQPEDVAHAVASLLSQAPQSFMSEILIRPTQKP